MGKTILFFSQKGGAGKTTTAVNLAAALALNRKRTLLIDCDPQCAATATAGIASRAPAFNLSDLLFARAAVNRCIVSSALLHLKLIPGPCKASLEDRARLSAPGSRAALKSELLPLKERFDYVLLDTPASDWPYIITAAVASDFVLFILRADFMSFRYLADGIENLGAIKRRLNPDLKSAGILLNQYDAADPESVRVLDSCRRHNSRSLFSSIIPRDAGLSGSAARGKPFLLTHLGTSTARSYLETAGELEARVQ